MNMADSEDTDIRITISSDEDDAVPVNLYRGPTCPTAMNLEVVGAATTYYKPAAGLSETGQILPGEPVHGNSRPTLEPQVSVVSIPSDRVSQGVVRPPDIYIDLSESPSISLATSSHDERTSLVDSDVIDHDRPETLEVRMAGACAVTHSPSGSNMDNSHQATAATDDHSTTTTSQVTHQQTAVVESQPPTLITTASNQTTLTPQRTLVMVDANFLNVVIKLAARHLESEKPSSGDANMHEDSLRVMLTGGGNFHEHSSSSGEPQSEQGQANSNSNLSLIHI